ncbi:MAG TPA: hypothetical protein VN519_09295 [Bryobacteraceae bacterium]|nr:hypothetical protein [Bryobacteraceae bacterium]
MTVTVAWSEVSPKRWNSTWKVYGFTAKPVPVSLAEMLEVT